jgi:hypothetical protein
LILEALKKLDREKQLPEKGFLVVAQAGWPARDASRGPWIVAGLLAGLALAAIVLLPRPESRPSPAPPRAGASAPAPVAAVPTRPVATRPSAPAATLPAAPVQVLTEPVLRPAPAATPPPSAAPLVLQAITQRDGRPLALINDRLVREGDELEGVRVIRIGEAEVEVEVAGKRSVLRF